MRLERSPARRQLRIQPTSDFALLTPNIGREASATPAEVLAREGGAIRGNVILKLEKPVKYQKIVVELIGRQEVLLGEVFHAYDVIRRSLTLDVGDEALTAGEHTFAFNFDVPSETASWEQCKFGRTYHKLTARAVAAGVLDTDLDAEMRFGVVANHAENRESPPNLHLSSKRLVDGLGTLVFAMSAPYLVHGGKLRLELDIFAEEEAEYPVHVEEIRVELDQTYKLQSLSEPDRVEDPPTETYLLWSSKDKEPGMPVLAAGQQYHLDRSFILPDDQHIRPSTATHTRTGIRVTHQLALVVRYVPILAGSEVPKMMRTRIALTCTMWMCFCAVEALQLPSYGQEPRALAEAFRKCDIRAYPLYY